ncbi:hypothetical protein BCY86_06215 [Pajaroellobacter abortibovis]|uniref:Gamma-butyrobetaine hydroxylase-like N-terminal domain-containing protein n=2 Tax=Pajaroellobacter abortibovis TaxID=1882918 RepID=A0A1L6MZU2_9BACT|nr:hypothetical protein BCY86_06215 [Pajaroellobacter abortibovis]
MGTPRCFKCKTVYSPKGGRFTEIEWGDGHRGIYPHTILRGCCPCAGCQGHSGTIKFVPPSDFQCELMRIEVIGNYALLLEWVDGHGSGIYSFPYLRTLCQCPPCKEQGARTRTE